MRYIQIWFWFCLLFLIGGNVNRSEAQTVDMGISLNSGGLQSFYLAVGNYYHIPREEVIVVQERGISETEIPVVLFLARQANVSSEVIIQLRKKGRSWSNITFYYGLSPAIYYVPINVAVTGPPYGNAYGYYRKKPKHQWKTIVLTDNEIINLVNLQFLSDYYAYSPEQIIQMRNAGKNFVVIHEQISHEKGGQGKGKGKGKGKKHK